MAHLPLIISDLAVILCIAVVVCFIFKSLKQPIVLGYLVAGVLVGPEVTFLPTIADRESVKVWAEIGVIFLLFMLGLEFSFRKLAHVGKQASITAIFEVLFMIGAGYVTGLALGWSVMDSIFLGGVLAISSTTIIVKALDELGLKGRRFVSLVFGVLIIEDLFAILLMVMLSTIGATKTFAGDELILSCMRFAFFLALWFVLGIYLVPTILKKVHSLLTDETMLIVAVGLCFMMVVLATNVGFSPALGAFVMGSILAETREGKRIEHLMMPLRDLFGAVFFISVGLLIDVTTLYQYFPTIALISVVTVVGKLLSTTIGALLSGATVRHSIQSGMSLAQIGEFSFIIATLGLSLNVTSDFLYPIAVAVSAITTFTTPYLIRAADPVAQWAERRIPAPILERLNRYQHALPNDGGRSALHLLWNTYGHKLFLNTTIVVGIVLGMRKIIAPRISGFFTGDDTAGFILALVTFIISLPFLWAIILGRPSAEKRTSQADLARLQSLQFGITVTRLVLGIALIIGIISQFAPLIATSGLMLLAAAALLLSVSGYAEPLYRFFEHRFLSNLNERDAQKLVLKTRPQLAPWDAIMAEVVVSTHSPMIAKTLIESEIKERFGVTIAMIERGEHSIVAPSRNERILPFDKLFLIGTEAELEKVQKILECSASAAATPSIDSYLLTSILLEPTTPWTGKVIRDIKIRESIDGLVVGIERNGKRILSPDSSLVLRAADRIWIVGDKKKITDLKTHFREVHEQGLR